MSGENIGYSDAPVVSYADAAQVKRAERDRYLKVNEETWPATDGLPEGWKVIPEGLVRKIAGEGEQSDEIPHPIEELVLRFPSAPINGLQRLHEHHMELGMSENFHTLRILRSADPEHLRKPISRIFFMHTGLNERSTMGLYYQLSSRLIQEDGATVCVVRPFPGHLTRYPFQALAETPLDMYLWDGSHLFRQFMRFMIETRWLFSTIVRRSSYRCASGADLLGESDDVDTSRLDAETLAGKMQEQWLSLHTASSTTAKAEVKEQRRLEKEATGKQQKRPPMNYALADQGQFLSAIESLRSILNLDHHFHKLSGDLAQDEGPPEPAMHVLGYSLGGFTAQSVFMSWPFVIASCSTVLAGGALRELAPTGFADPEEWQTVLHSLRYELDDRMMSPSLGVSRDSVAGIERDLFVYLKRTFYEVFQQEYQRSMQTRYEAFGDRMLFIVGGNDPVVRPESVLQSGPKGGLNLLEIGNLGHMLQDGGSDVVGEKQKEFWLPEMATLIDRFSNKVAKEHLQQRDLTWFDARLSTPALSTAEWLRRTAKSSLLAADDSVVRELRPEETIAIGRDGALPGELFERCLDDLLHRVAVADNGILFVLRNEIPTAFLPPQAVRETASALYHDDYSIVRYCHGVDARRDVIKKKIDKICLVLPWNARSIMRRMDIDRAFPSQAESAGGRVAGRLTGDALFRESLTHCYRLAAMKKGQQSIRMFDGNMAPDEPGDDLQELIVRARDFTRDNAAESAPSLPDTWVWVSNDFLVPPRNPQPDVKKALGAIIAQAAIACGSERQMLEFISDGQIRIVNVSRARYNPRFRGRLVVDGKAALKRFLHVALCIGFSQTIADQPQSIFT